jgi:hypothetical protein
MLHGASLNGPEKASMLGSNRQRTLMQRGENIGPRERTAYVDFSAEV